MNVIAAVAIFTRDIASRINPIEDGKSGSRFLDGQKFTVAQQKTMDVAIAGTIETGDHALRVDMQGGGETGSRRVDGSKLTLAQQKTVKSATAVNIGPPRCRLAG